MSLPFSHHSAARFLRMPPPFNTFGTLRLVLVVGVVLLPRLSSAQWTATIGAQSHDLARQSLAFLPNEIWIHAGDSITWTLATNERHTVTFLPANQAVPDVSTSCPGFANGAAICPRCRGRWRRSDQRDGRWYVNALCDALSGC